MSARPAPRRPKGRAAPLVIGALALLALAPAAIAERSPSRVQKLEAREDGAKTVITIRGTATPTFTVYKLEKPERVVVDVANAELGLKLDGPVAVNAWAVAQIFAQELGESDAAVTRVIVQFARPASYQVKAVGNDVVVTVTAREAPPAPVAAAPAGDGGKAARAEAEAAKAEAAREKQAAADEKAAAARAKAEAEAAKAEAAREKQAAADAKAEAAREKQAAADAKAAAAERMRAADARMAAAENSQKAAEAERARAEKSRAEADKALAAADQRRADAEKAAAAAAERARRAEAAGDADAKKKRADAEAAAARAEKALAEAEARKKEAEKAAARAEARRADADQAARAAVDAKASADAERQRAVAERDRARAETAAAEKARREAEKARRAEEERAAAVTAARRAEEERTGAATAARAAEEKAAAVATDKRARAEAAAAEAEARRKDVEARKKAAEAAEGEAEARRDAAEAASAEAERVAAAKGQASEEYRRADARAKQAARERAAAEKQLETRRAELAAEEARAAKVRGDRDRLRAEAERAKQDADAARAQKAEAEAGRARVEKARQAEEQKLAEARAAREAEERRLAAAEARRKDAEARAARADADAAAARERQAAATPAPAPAPVAAAPAPAAPPAKAAPAPAPKAAPAPARASVRVADVDYVDRDAHARVVVQLSGPAEPQVLAQGGRQAILSIPGADLPEALERSLDTSEFSGPITAISSYRDPRDPSRVRIVVDLAEPARAELKRAGNTWYWDFTKPAGMATRGKAKPRAGAAPAKARTNVAYEAPVVGGYGAASTPVTAQTVAQKKKVYRGKRISLEIKDADLHNLLRLLAQVGDVNIVVPDNIRASVTVRLTDVPWDQALEVVLQSKGLWYRREGRLIRIDTRKKLDEEDAEERERQRAKIAEEPPEAMIFTLNYADAGNVAGNVRPLLSPKGKIEVDNRTNSLIISDVRANRANILALLNELDSQTPQIQIEARIVEARSTWSRDIGIQWGFGALASAAGGNPTGLIFPSSVGVAGGASDGRTPTDGLLGGAAANPNFAVNLPAAVGTGAGGALGFTFGSVGGNFNLNLRLSAAEEQGTVRIVSAPKIVVLNNERATISQGVSIPISVVSANGVSTQFVPADLSLTVRPHVSERDCSIQLSVDVSKNEADFVNTGARGDPTILRKEAKTTMLIGDGETQVIGGIYTRNSGKSKSKVPFFGDIPIIGYFFRQTRENDERTEVLIFLTPKITNKAQLRCEGRPQE